MADQADWLWQIGHRSACGHRLSLQPISSTPALSVTWTVPLQLQYSAWGNIQVLYAFAFICHSTSCSQHAHTLSMSVKSLTGGFPPLCISTFYLAQSSAFTLNFVSWLNCRFNVLCHHLQLWPSYSQHSLSITFECPWLQFKISSM